MSKANEGCAVDDGNSFATIPSQGQKEEAVPFRWQLEPQGLTGLLVLFLLLQELNDLGFDHARISI
jgi:hypothetical protein